MIPVTKPYLPCREKLDRYIDGIYERGWLTNNGPLVQELTRRLEEYLGVENLLLVSNGTLALQIAYRALGISGEGPCEAITTPFTYVATASSLKWEGIDPVFVDINPDTWCLEPDNIEAAITSATKAIVPVHVFGNACEVEAIDRIAEHRGLKVIYDGAHAFGITYNGESLLKYGDATSLSFHATKLFHSIEGGAIIFKHKEDMERARRMINFGLVSAEEIVDVGINAKMSEFHAAMGLCVLDEIDENISNRSNIWHEYYTALLDNVQLQFRKPHVSCNYSYFPLLLNSDETVKYLIARLSAKNIQTRRYFYPSLHAVEEFSNTSNSAAPISDNISNRILCLPIFSGLSSMERELIINIVREEAKK
ncbi:DegT/DnrJ/EryC1/StrS family aminotransferase [Halomonas alkalisoli]|uniref:DegT/DnrJ/EryC1/StrS family aminotransferase n=1 Tax=Halomonas alkalisoli TaxID=2907158 RepID=UPI001F32D46B|nr:DegT/DnrJ/EryC1/StrS family aminotransferase [Halomonas alkalisoli]MCE9683145.1 DegT/DnrJ/EryC1/StrS family aminotransferase [Halomonas alkalisoli]